jgi:hypothetical protein
MICFFFFFFISFRKGDDSVVMCKSTINRQYFNQEVDNYYNSAKNGTQIVTPENKSIGIFNTRFIYNNRYLICEFSRFKSVPNIERIYDLNKAYYLLMAAGATNVDGW